MLNDKMEEVNSLIQSDAELSDLSEYSPEYHSQITTDWQHICTALTNSATLWCSEARYRFACGDVQGELNYWPPVMNYCPQLISFIRTILIERFMKRRSVISVNFAPSMLILETDGTCQFLYSSRSSFSCLPKSVLLHNEASYLHFINETLSNYSLSKYIEDTLVALNQRYEGVAVPLSLTFFFTKCHDKIYGRMKYFERGLSNRNECLWMVLSTIYDVNGGKIVQRNHLARRGRCNAKIARKLKAKFLAWLFRHHGAKVNPITPNGFHQDGFPYLEQFLGSQISIYELRCKGGLKLRGNKLIPSGKRVKYFSVRYLPTSNNSYNINLLCDSNHHLRAVLDLNQFSWKIICRSCQRIFKRQEKLNEHTCEGPRYIADKAVTWIKPINRSLSEDFGIHEHPKFSRKFILVTLTKEDSGIGVTINCEVKANKKATFTHSFQAVTEIVTYLLSFLPKLALPLLVELYVKNVSPLKIIENAYGRCEADAKSALFKEDQAVKRWETMKQLREQVIDILSHIVVFMHTEEVKLCSLMEEVNMEILRQMCQMKLKPSLSCSRGRINTITAEGSPLKFKTLPHVAPCFAMKDSNAAAMFDIVCKITHELWHQFEVDFILCNTPAQIGRLLLSSSMNLKHLTCLFSPHKEIQVLIEKQSRFGLLACKKQVVHERSAWKGGCHVDFSKFYAGILKNFYVMLGRPLVWCKSSTGRYEITRNRSRATLANLLILLIEHVTESVALCAMFCKERRHTYPVDAEIAWPNGTKKILSVAGCFWHAHCMSEQGAICHAPKSTIPKQHLDSCSTCKNAELPHDNLRPHLFRLREDESGQSNHPVRKDKTYQEVFEESEKNLKIVSENSSGISLMVIHECEIVKYYYAPVTEFLKEFGLPAKPHLQHAIFADVYRNVASQYFPLLKADSLSKLTLIEHIKSGKLRGLVIVTAKMGNLARERLGIAAPFVMKSENGNQATFDLENAILPTNFLKFMLNCEFISDFHIIDIAKVYEYHFTEKPIFSESVEKAMIFMENHHCEKEMVNLLKTSLNASIGHLGVQSWKYANSVVATEQELSRFNPWENLVKSVSLDEKHAILYTSNHPMIINLAHIHFDLIYQGRMEMLRFLLALKHFLHVDVSRINTDGAILTFEMELSDTDLKNQTSVALDQFLRSRNMSHLSAYLEFKKNYFSDLGVCEVHEPSYIKVLSNGLPFEQPSCCLRHVHVPKYKKLRIEGFFDKCVIESVNRLATYNTITKHNIVKCSGVRNERLFEMHEYSPDELDILFPY